jgi:hypothetical protein
VRVEVAEWLSLAGEDSPSVVEVVGQRRVEHEVRDWLGLGVKRLRDIRFRRLPTDRPIHLLIDSTGFRIHVGPMQKPPKNRASRKFHLGVDAAAGEIVASDLSARRTHDST